MNIKPSPLAYANTAGRPTWSPDSRRVAASVERDTVVLDRADESVLSTLGPEGAWVNAADWSPDGSRIAYSAYTTEEGQELPSWHIYSSNPDGSDPKLLSSDGWEPEFNPQGDKIAFHLVKGSDDQIAIMDLESGDTRVVNQPGILQRDFSWDPRGQQIVYDTVSAEGNFNRITDVTGEKDRAITDGEGGLWWDNNPEWSPMAARFCLNAIAAEDPTMSSGR